MDFRHLIVTCLFSMLRLPFDNQKVKENYAIFLLKNKVFFLFDLLFLGEQDFTYVRAALYICTCRSIRMYVPQIPALYYMIFFLHSAFIFISLLYLCEERV